MIKKIEGGRGRRQKVPFIVALLVSVFIWTTLQLPAVAAQSVRFGVHLDDGVSLAPQLLPLARKAGAQGVTVTFEWDKVEAIPGRFVWSSQEEMIAAARALEIAVVGVLPYRLELPLATERTGDRWPSGHRYDWTFFVSEVIGRFGTQVDAWVIEGGPGWGGTGLFAAADAQLHAEFAQLTSEAIRQRKPDALVFVRAPAPDIHWIRLFVHFGGLASVDGFALDVNRWPAAPYGMSAVVDDVRALLEEMDETALLWGWKLGYPTHRGRSLSEPRLSGVTYEEQAAYIVQSYVLLAAAGVETVFFDGLIDTSPADGEAGHNFGLYEWNGMPKPAARAFTTMTRLLQGLHYAQPGDVIQRPVLPADDVADDARKGVQDEADDGTEKVYHFVFDFERFSEQTRKGKVAVVAHVFTGEPSTVILVWTEPALPTGGCRYGCGHVDFLRWLDGVPVRAYDFLGQPLLTQTDLKLDAGPFYFELPMELVP